MAKFEHCQCVRRLLFYDQFSKMLFDAERFSIVSTSTATKSTEGFGIHSRMKQVIPVVVRALGSGRRAKSVVLMILATRCF